MTNNKQLVSTSEVYSILGGKRDVRTGAKVTTGDTPRGAFRAKVDGEVSFKVAGKLAEAINKQFEKDIQK
jgi:hypothetical protein